MMVMTVFGFMLLLLLLALIVTILTLLGAQNILDLGAHWLTTAFLWTLTAGFALGGIMLLIAWIRHYFRQRKIMQKLKYRIRRRARGVVFGKTPWRLVCSPESDEGHTAIIGGSGSGKTSALLIPTLRAWNGTALVFDISGDITATVNTRRAIYAPEEVNTTPYDVFAAVDIAPADRDKNERLQQLAFTLIPEMPGSDGTTAFFAAESRKLLGAALIALFHEGLDFVPCCRRIMENSADGLLADINASGNTLALMLAAGFRGGNEKALAATVQEIHKAVSLFATNDKISTTLRRDGMSPQTLEEESLYIVIPDEKLQLYAPLLRLISVQTLHYLAGRPNGAQPKILLALDEFSSLNKLEIRPALQKLRKKNVRVLICTQSLADLDLIYGIAERKTILDNIQYMVILGARDYDTQLSFSLTAGEMTAKNGHREKIIYPEDFARLRNHLILLHPGGVMKLKKNYYFKKWIF